MRIESVDLLLLLANALNRQAVGNVERLRMVGDAQIFVAPG